MTVPGREVTWGFIPVPLSRPPRLGSVHDEFTPAGHWVNGVLAALWGCRERTVHPVTAQDE